ncbi:hypothetical protein DC244_24145 [Salmonella enterica subsp. enterica serovar Typhimurium]|nr:hypothetical protein [Salmonella enterica subsp. enterica serovar Typhimurium]EKM0745878.1 hypothetical protein [Escherichia coli]
MVRKSQILPLTLYEKTDVIAPFIYKTDVGVNACWRSLLAGKAYIPKSKPRRKRKERYLFPMSCAEVDGFLSVKINIIREFVAFLS